jgi:hypothetical protein
MISGRTRWTGYGLLAAMLGIALLGCASAPSSSPPKSQDELLIAAGFNSYVANNPKSLAYLKTLPPQEIVQHRYKGADRYLVCTDQNSRACYVGDEAAYQRYQNLATQADIAARQRTVSEKRWDPEAQLLYMDSQGGGR